MASKLQRKLREIAKRNLENEKLIDAQEAAKRGDDVPMISTTSKQYKALISRLEKHDNDKTDAIRMALFYLESGGNVAIDQLEKFIRS